MFMAVTMVLAFEVQLMVRAFSRALESAGSSMEARIAMIAMTTSSSMRVKDLRSMVGVSLLGWWKEKPKTVKCRTISLSRGTYVSAWGNYTTFRDVFK